MQKHNDLDFEDLDDLDELGDEGLDVDDDWLFDDEDLDFEDEDIDLEDDVLDFEDQDLNDEGWVISTAQEVIEELADVTLEEPEIVVALFEEEDQGDKALEMLEDLGLSLDDDVAILRHSDYEDEEDSWLAAVEEALTRGITSVPAEDTETSRDEWHLEGMGMVVLVKVRDLDANEIEETLYRCGAAEVEYYPGADEEDLTSVS